MKDLTSNTGGPKIDKKKQDNTHNGAHCDNIKEFVLRHLLGIKFIIFLFF